ncbi:predicted protein [Nematostella vectensis]|uniref:15-hydroxyprostaglandin dehydrogenase [NAD(+)] n=1 Tax=Nematostella vectensis TaxID=45351 RepID=A7SGX6_NEMVE|nr:15-hydroxyprostaglandin dehydrogenase [NAD(+)] [Nematostella vectensis]EDO37087.1 predicted protein [Nematostella vectensis]|eukprot:XP_001629150.1 predicted protein [Nematostella vectensis]
MKIEGTVAIVTGGVQGIGLAISKALLDRDGKVCMLDINEKTGNETLKLLSENYSKHRVLFIKCDVTSQPQMEAAFQRTKDVFGRLDILCNNAGIAVRENDLLRSGAWKTIIDINVKGVILGTLLGLDHMGVSGAKGHGGTIVNVASLAGLVPAPASPVYTASKHAVVGLTRTLTSLWATECVRVNCICPSFTDTAMVRTAIHQDTSNLTFLQKSRIAKIQAMGLLSPELIAEGVVRLIEDDTKIGAVMRATPQRGLDYKKYFTPKL